MLEPEEIDKRIDEFKNALTDLNPTQIIRKHLISGESAILENSSYFDLRCEVANRFSVHPNEVLVVGSSKLGFSIAPGKRYRHFCDTSDVDVVIVSASLFDKMWKTVHRFSNQGGYWERSNEFKDYLFRGWIRPDKLPPSNIFAFGRGWWEFFNSLSSDGRFSVYKITGALYKDWYFLEAYQRRAVSACIDDLPGKGANP